MVDVLLFVLGVLILVALIGASIALHEIGHMVPAKRFGVKVTQYMVGFGPTMWSRKRGETEYGIKWLPLGGYIRMIGMFPPDRDGNPRSGTTGRWATIVADTKAAAAAEYGPDEEHRTFYRLSVPKKLIVMIGGPFMNLVLAVVFFTILVVGVGVAVPTTQINAVVTCVPSVENPTGAVEPKRGCGSGLRSTAATAGLEAGETIVAIDGLPLERFTDLTAAMTDGGERTAVLTVRGADGTVRDVPVPLRSVPVAERNAQGEPTGDVTERIFLGVSPTVVDDRSPLQVPSIMWDVTVRSLNALVTLPVRVVELGVDTATGAGRAEDSPVSVVGVSRLGGEVVSADEPVGWKFAWVIQLAAGLNLFLFLFNLLPILPLDGGHVAGALYEGARRRLAFWRKRPDPGPVDVARAMPFAYGVVAVMLAFSLVVVWADLVNPVRPF